MARNSEDTSVLIYFGLIVIATFSSLGLHCWKLDAFSWLLLSLCKDLAELWILFSYGLLLTLLSVFVQSDVCIVFVNIIYEGRSINKLRNSAILLILKIGKIRNICFVGNLILNIYRNFLMMTLSVHWTQPICVLCSPPVFYHNLQVINSIGMRKTNKLNKMIVDDSVHWISWNTGVPNNVWNWHTPVGLYESINCGSCGFGRCNNMPARSFLISSAFSAASKLCTPNTCCWSRKTLVAIHWRHLRVNLICIKSFCPQKKQITACCSLQDDQWQCRHI